MTPYGFLSGNVSTSCIREMLNRDTGYFMCISLIIWQPLIYSIFLPILSLNGPNPFYLLILKILHSSTYFNLFFFFRNLFVTLLSPTKTLTKTECSIPVGSVLFIYLPHYAVCNVFSTLFLMPHDTSFAVFISFCTDNIDYRSLPAEMLSGVIQTFFKVSQFVSQ